MHFRTTFIFFALILVNLAEAAEVLQAIAYIQGLSSISGNVTIEQKNNNQVNIWGKIMGLPGGTHGFHIHEKGDITNGCGSTGAHFNPYKKAHGAPTDVERHVGDLGNIQADNNGVALISMTDSLITLSGPNSVLGRAFVIHQDADDLGKGGFSDSKTTGHAGSRLACGVIGVLTPIGSWPTSGASTLASWIILPLVFNIIIGF